jgi:hypothetical protein
MSHPQTPTPAAPSGMLRDGTAVTQLAILAGSNPGVTAGNAVTGGSVLRRCHSDRGG